MQRNAVPHYAAHVRRARMMSQQCRALPDDISPHPPRTVGHPDNDLGTPFGASPMLSTSWTRSPTEPSGREHWEPSVQMASRCVMATAQAGQNGARTQSERDGAANPYGCVGEAGEGHPHSTPVPNPSAWSPQANGRGFARERLSTGAPMNHRRRQPRPLAKPPFGPPASGIECRLCHRWFHRRHFWRRQTKSFGNRCPSCRQPRRSATGLD
jgi:hypothetical protein